MAIFHLKMIIKSSIVDSIKIISECLQATDLPASRIIYLEKTMEQLIKTIIDVDKKARKMTDQSKKQLAESTAAIAKRIEELDKKYEESVEEIIALTTEDEAQKVEELLAKIDADYSKANQNLDAYYEAHKDQWVDTLVERTLADK